MQREEFGTWQDYIAYFTPHEKLEASSTLPVPEYFATIG
jgi:hypothetical protein